MFCVLFIIIDQVIKYYITKYKPIKVLIPKILRIVYTENTGTVFGIAPRFKWYAKHSRYCYNYFSWYFSVFSEQKNILKSVRHISWY